MKNEACDQKESRPARQAIVTSYGYIFAIGDIITFQWSDDSNPEFRGEVQGKIMAIEPASGAGEYTFVLEEVERQENV